MLRIPPDVHSAALVAAQAAGTSLNQGAAKVLAEAAQGLGHRLPDVSIRARRLSRAILYVHKLLF